MPQYRQKPVVVDAVQYSKQLHIDIGEVPEGVTKDYFADDDGVAREKLPIVKTLRGDMNVADGDWIIKGVQGEFYPCTPDIFEATYEAVKEE